MLNVTFFLVFLFTLTNNIFAFSFECFMNLELMMNMQVILQRDWNECRKAELDVVHSILWPPLWLLISQAFRGTSTILETAFAYFPLCDKCDI